MAKVDDWVIIGRFGRPHGLKGFVAVNSFTDPHDNILRYTDWHGLINQKWQPLTLGNIEINNKSILAKVEGYSAREQVAALTNIDIAIKRQQLPELKTNEFYWHQLLDMQVVNVRGVDLGQLVEIMSTGSNDVLVVMGKKRHLIPYLPEVVVINIDEDKKIITVDWDEDF